MSTIENTANVVAVDHLADESIIFLECCNQNDTATLRSNQDPKFALPAIAFGVSTDRTKIAALDNNTGKISVYDVLANSTRTIDTPRVKQAPWIGSPGESIAWSRDDQQLAFTAAGNGETAAACSTSTSTPRRTWISSARATTNGSRRRSAWLTLVLCSRC
jgi:hypothetical protein